ncbi:hypothetical protein JX265_009928 [Neoarthrinium moseri]|uniref:Clr5 domain-containing protein n=1 Tax=Neoarthrinium moseri TaxID=1658444 RepID=A0A9P9WFB9_9PEZI|nr:hypothetical protein JX265_009928 [Neoarthrinium moseri]
MTLAMHPRSTRPTGADWDTHRPVITRLYWDEGKPLKEVRAIMANEHGFKATVKMYKVRFKQWGLTKNLSSRRVAHILEAAMDGKPTQLPVIQGRQLGSQRVKRCMQNLATAFGATIIPPQTVRKQSPPIFVSAPDIMRFPEGCLQAVIDFATGRMDGDSFGLSGPEYPWMEDKSLNVWHNSRMALTKIAEKRNSPLYFSLLNKAFDQYSVAIDRLEPTLVWVSLLCILLLAQVGEDLARTFVEYSARLCAIKLGPVHPLTRLWSMVRCMSVDEVRRAVVVIFEAYFASCQSDVRPGEEVRRVSIVHVARALLRVGAISFETASATIKNIEKEFKDRCVNTVDAEWYWWCRIFHCQLLYDHRKFDEADGDMPAIGRHLHCGNPDLNFDDIEDEVTVMTYYALKPLILEARGLMDEATRYYVASYEFTKKIRGHSYSRMVSVTASLEGHYRRKGDLEAAERIREEFESAWKTLVKVGK